MFSPPDALNLVNTGGIMPMLCSLLMPSIVIVMALRLVLAALNMRDQRVLVRAITAAELAVACEAEYRARTTRVADLVVCLPRGWRGEGQVRVATPRPRQRPEQAMPVAA